MTTEKQLRDPGNKSLQAPLALSRSSLLAFNLCTISNSIDVMDYQEAGIDLDYQLHREKLEHGVWIEEYKAIRSEIERRLGWQNQTLGICVAALGALVTAAATMIKEGVWNKDYAAILLGIPFVVFCFGMQHMDHDAMLFQLAKYQEKVLKPRLNWLTGANVLEWHSFLGAKYDFKRRGFLQPLLSFLCTPFPHAFFVAVGFGSLYLCFDYDRLARLQEAALMMDAKQLNVKWVDYQSMFPQFFKGTFAPLTGGLNFLFWIDIGLMCYFTLCAMLSPLVNKKAMP